MTRPTACGYPWQQMIIDLTGEVVPCCFWSGYGNGGKPLGNTNTQTIEEIWNGPEYQALRRANVNGDPPEGHPCRKCLAYRWSNDQYPPFRWPNPITHDDRLAYRIPSVPDSLRAAALAGGAVSFYENGIELSPGEALHDDIRALGGGRYSLWNGALYFSASDNSDPRSNGRVYELVCGEERGVVAGLHSEAPSGQNLLQAHDEYMAAAETMTARPSMLTLVSTADCNIDCPACSQNIVRQVRVQHRPETVPGVLALVPYLYEFTWQGGEPFLIKRLRDFVDSFRAEDNPNLVFGFTSNGTMVTAREVEKLKKFPALNASVSIDSFNAETFGKIRTGASLQRVLQNTLKLYELYDAPRRVISVGMIVCKENMPELADNLRQAIAHDIGMNLSPVLVYPVTERLDVFEDFEAQTQGWAEALAAAELVVEEARRAGRLAIQRIDPAGMIRELRDIYERQRERHADIVEVEVVIRDPFNAIRKMNNPGWQ